MIFDNLSLRGIGQVEESWRFPGMTGRKKERVREVKTKSKKKKT